MYKYLIFIGNINSLLLSCESDYHCNAYCLDSVDQLNNVCVDFVLPSKYILNYYTNSIFTTHQLVLNLVIAEMI